MNYAVYGANRVAKDFLYIFEDLDIICFFDDVVSDECFLGRPVFSASEIGRNRSRFDQLILCDFDKAAKIAQLQKSGFSYGKDYLLEQDFFARFDEKEFNQGQKKIAVWGTGSRSQNLMKFQKNMEVEFFIDTYKTKEEFSGRPVFRPEEVEGLENYYIILALAKADEIIGVLEQKGMKWQEDYCTSHEFILLPSHLLTRTIFDTNCYDLNCKTMHNHCEIGDVGNLYFCCATFLYHPTGNVNDNTFDEIWNGVVHKIMCLSMENKTYSFCNKELCPLFIGRDGKSELMEFTEYEKMQDRVKTISVGLDDSCNLKCVTCRKELYIAQKEELEQKKYYVEIVKRDMMQDAEFVIMAGAGEVFCSPVYRDFYTSDVLNGTKWIRLLTNGTLFNEKNWQTLIRNKTAKFMLTVSVDAATKDTYEHIRKGGNFEILKRNMAFAARLRKKGELSYFRMNFVVQKENYKEMIPFVEWGLELGTDEIFFTKIRNWGTYTKEEFKEISMMEEDGMTPKEELVKVLEHPVMKNPIVDLGTIWYSHEPVKEKYIENYYRWELERKVPGLFR